MGGPYEARALATLRAPVAPDGGIDGLRPGFHGAFPFRELAISEFLSVTPVESEKSAEISHFPAPCADG
jgi:hypothetical protein